MECGRYLLSVAVLLAVLGATVEAAGSEEGNVDSVTASPHDTLERDGTDAATAGDSEPDTSAAALPLCSLEIVTDPAGAAVVLDGKQVGASPLVVAGVDTGKHALLIQKVGFYQKKATVLLASRRKTTLRFQLSAPGRLTIVTEPTAAAVTINNERKGESPYIDSLMKPGVYFLMLEKEHYQPIADSISIPSGGRLSRSDTLQFTKAYSDSLHRATALVLKRRKRIGMGAVAGAFALFLLVPAIIEMRE